MDSCIAGICLFGTFGVIMLACLVFGWKDHTWRERFAVSLITIFLGLGSGLCWIAKARLLKRVPVISSYVAMDDGCFQICDSTVRCKSGLEPRFTVVKPELKMRPNDQTRCINCGRIFINHLNQSCVKTDDELDAEAWVQYMNAP